MYHSFLYRLMKKSQKRKKWAYCVFDLHGCVRLPAGIIHRMGRRLCDFFPATVIDGRTGKNTDVRSGSIITGRIYSILPDALLIRTIKGTAKAHVTNLFDDAIDRPLQQFKINQIVRFAKITLSVREVWASIPGPRKLATVSPTARKRCGVFLELSRGDGSRHSLHASA